MKRFLFFLLTVLLAAAPSQAYYDHLTPFPAEGQQVHYDLNIDFYKDLVSGVARDTTEGHRHRGYKDTYVATSTMMVPLPACLFESSSGACTILMRMVNAHDDDLEKFSMQGFPVGISADDDELEFTLFHDSLLAGAQRDYELPLRWIPYTAKPIDGHETVVAVTIQMLPPTKPLHVSSPHSYIRENTYYPVRIGIAAKDRYVVGYRAVPNGVFLKRTVKITCSEGWTLASPGYIGFNEVAVYDRILTPGEIQAAIGSEKLEVEMPEDYRPYFGWTILPYILIALLLFVVVALCGGQMLTYISPARLRRAPGTGDRAIALRLMAEAQGYFGTGEELHVPDEASLARAEQCLKEAVENGCADDDMLAEYNRIGSLINHCRQTDSTYSRVFYAMVPFIILCGAIVTGYDYGTYLPIWNKQEMVPYYLTCLLCALIGQRLKGAEPGSRILTAEVKKLKPSLLSKVDDWLQGLSQVVSGVTTSSLVSGTFGLKIFFSMFLYVIAIGLKVMLSCIYEFVVVIVGTGEVVTSGVGGLSVGLVAGFAVVGLLVWLFMKVTWLLINAFLWLVVPAVGVIALCLAFTGLLRVVRGRR